MMRQIPIRISVALMTLSIAHSNAHDASRSNGQRGFTAAEVNSIADAAHQAWVDEVRSQTTSRAGIIALREGPLGENWDITTTDKWMQTFNAQILDPPWEFSVADPVDYSNDTASNALRSIFHAEFMMDYDALNSLTDDPSLKESNEYYLQPVETIRALRQAMFPGLMEAINITVLLVGHLEWEGTEYVYYLFRASHAESPRENQYIFGSHAFRRYTGENVYWLTHDLRYSGISNYLVIATPHDPHTSKRFGTYQEMYEYYKESDVPAHFYTFGEKEDEK